MPCECIIHETFSGVLQSNVKCLGCHNVTTTLDPFIDISLELRREKADSLIEKHGIKYDSTLLDCLSKYDFCLLLVWPYQGFYECWVLDLRTQRVWRRISTTVTGAGT